MALPMQKFVDNTRLVLRDAAREEGNVARRVIALVSTGSYCPVHRMHLEVFEIARRELEKEDGVSVVAGFLSPSHDGYVRSKLASDAIAAVHRVAMVRVATGRSSWLSEAGWEAEQEGFVDYPQVTAHYRAELQKMFESLCEEVQADTAVVVKERVRLQVFYLCGADHALKCHLFAWVNRTCYDGVIAAGRKTKETEELARRTHVDGFTLLEVETAKMSSTSVRERMRQRSSIATMVPPGVAEYIAEQGITIGSSSS